MKNSIAAIILTSGVIILSICMTFLTYLREDYKYCLCETTNSVGTYCISCGKIIKNANNSYSCSSCEWESQLVSVPAKYCPECGEEMEEMDEK